MFCYEQTGVVATPSQAKDWLKQFWELMPELKQWHQNYPTPREAALTLSGRFCYSFKASHAQQMAHRVFGSLDDLNKTAMTQIAQALKPMGGTPYLILEDYLIWEVPAKKTETMLDLAVNVLTDIFSKNLR